MVDDILETTVYSYRDNSAWWVPFSAKGPFYVDEVPKKKHYKYGDYWYSDYEDGRLYDYPWGDVTEAWVPPRPDIPETQTETIVTTTVPETGIAVTMEQVVEKGTQVAIYQPIEDVIQDYTTNVQKQIRYAGSSVLIIALLSIL